MCKIIRSYISVCWSTDRPVLSPLKSLWSFLCPKEPGSLVSVLKLKNTWWVDKYMKSFQCSLAWHECNGLFKKLLCFINFIAKNYSSKISWLFSVGDDNSVKKKHNKSNKSEDISLGQGNINATARKTCCFTKQITSR